LTKKEKIMDSGRSLLTWTLGRDTGEVDEAAIWSLAEQILETGTPRGDRMLLILGLLTGRTGPQLNYGEVGKLCPRIDNGVRVNQGLWPTIGLTRERVRQIEARALILLRKSRKFRELAQIGEA
jgi:hypothetical protein